MIVQKDSTPLLNSFPSVKYIPLTAVEVAGALIDSVAAANLGYTFSWLKGEINIQVWTLTGDELNGVLCSLSFRSGVQRGALWFDDLELLVIATLALALASTSKRKINFGSTTSPQIQHFDMPVRRCYSEGLSTSRWVKVEDERCGQGGQQWQSQDDGMMLKNSSSESKCCSSNDILNANAAHIILEGPNHLFIEIFVKEKFSRVPS